MATAWMELIGGILGGGTLGAVGKALIDRRRGVEATYYAGLEARITKLETREDELQEELKLRIEREGELATKNALLERETLMLRTENEELRQRVELREQKVEELRRENEELRQHKAALSTELMAQRHGSEQLTTIRLEQEER